MKYERVLEEIQSQEERQKAIKENLQTMKELSLKNRKERQKSKKDLEETKEIIENYLQKIDNATTFSTKVFFSFLLKFLEIVEQKEMEAAEVVQDYSLEMDPKPSKKQKKQENWFINQMLLDPRDKYILLARKEEVEQIKNLLNICTLMTAMEIVPIKKYIFIPSDNEEVHLANRVELNKEWHRFPEIKHVFERLIDLGLEDEEMTPQERLDKVLCEVKENREENIERAIHLKKQTTGD